MERLQAKRDILQQRYEIIQELIRIVDGPLSRGEEFYSSSTPRNSAIVLLGELRAEESVSSLVEWIEPHEGQSMVIEEEQILPPAALALAKIGMPAVTPLFQRVKIRGMEPSGRICFMTMVRILESDLTDAKLENALAGEENEEYEKNIQAALEALRNGDIPVEKLERSR